VEKRQCKEKWWLEPDDIWDEGRLDDRETCVHYTGCLTAAVASSSSRVCYPLCDKFSEISREEYYDVMRSNWDNEGG